MRVRAEGISLLYWFRNTPTFRKNCSVWGFICFLELSLIMWYQGWLHFSVVWAVELCRSPALDSTSHSYSRGSQWADTGDSFQDLSECFSPAQHLSKWVIDLVCLPKTLLAFMEQMILFIVYFALHLDASRPVHQLALTLWAVSNGIVASVLMPLAPNFLNCGLWLPRGVTQLIVGVINIW